MVLMMMMMIIMIVVVMMLIIILGGTILSSKLLPRHFNLYITQNFLPISLNLSALLLLRTTCGLIYLVGFLTSGFTF